MALATSEATSVVDESSTDSDREESCSSASDTSETDAYAVETWTWEDTQPAANSDAEQHGDTEELRPHSEGRSGEDGRDTDSVTESHLSSSDESDGLSDDERISQAIEEFDPAVYSPDGSNSDTAEDGFLTRLLGVWLRQWWRKAVGRDSQTQTDADEDVRAEGSVGVAVGGRDTGRDDG